MRHTVQMASHHKKVFEKERERESEKRRNTSHHFVHLIIIRKCTLG